MFCSDIFPLLILIVQLFIARPVISMGITRSILIRPKSFSLPFRSHAARLHNKAFPRFTSIRTDRTYITTNGQAKTVTWSKPTESLFQSTKKSSSSSGVTKKKVGVNSKNHGNQGTSASPNYNSNSNPSHAGAKKVMTKHGQTEVSPMTKSHTTNKGQTEAITGSNPTESLVKSTKPNGNSNSPGSSGVTKENVGVNPNNKNHGNQGTSAAPNHNSNSNPSHAGAKKVVTKPGQTEVSPMTKSHTTNKGQTEAITGSKRKFEASTGPKPTESSVQNKKPPGNSKSSGSSGTTDEKVGVKSINKNQGNQAGTSASPNHNSNSNPRHLGAKEVVSKHRKTNTLAVNNGNRQGTTGDVPKAKVGVAKTNTLALNNGERAKFDVTQSVRKWDANQPISERSTNIAQNMKQGQLSTSASPNPKPNSQLGAKRPMMNAKRVEDNVVTPSKSPMKESTKTDGTMQESTPKVKQQSQPDRRPVHQNDLINPHQPTMHFAKNTDKLPSKAEVVRGIHRMKVMPNKAIAKIRNPLNRKRALQMNKFIRRLQRSNPKIQIGL